jgi:hypothetical protein
MIMLLRQQALKPWVNKAAHRRFRAECCKDRIQDSGVRSQEKNKQRDPQSFLNPVFWLYPQSFLNPES